MYYYSGFESVIVYGSEGVDGGAVGSVQKTFAWFTSTDDVTNRLTASADYGVSIVESFTPPKQWVPGQTVEKDVYAVNTGNIAAFVNEDISGVMTVTYEVKADTFNANEAVKLNDTEVATTMIDGATTHEAGAFLAYTDASGVDTGYVVSSRTEDNLNGAWHPTVNGVYIFRRGITVANDGTETYKYDGYYYNGGNYYKIAIGNVIVTPDTEGKLTSATFKYINATTDTAKNIGLQYDANGKRLVAKYTINNADAVTNYDAQAQAARNEADVNKATAELSAAQTAYDNAKAEYDAMVDLVAKRNALIQAAKDYKAAADGKATASGAVTEKTTALGTTAGTASGNVTTAKEKLGTLADIKANTTGYTEGSAILTSINSYNSKVDGIETYVTALTNAIDDLKDGNPDNMTAVSSAWGTLKTKADELYDSYAEILTVATYETDGDTKKNKLLEFKNAVDALDFTALTTAVNELKAANATNTSTASADATAYNAAVDAYTSAYETAKAKNETTANTYHDLDTSKSTDADFATDGKGYKANADATPSADLATSTYRVTQSYQATYGDTAADTEKTVDGWLEELNSKKTALGTEQGKTVWDDKNDIVIYINLDDGFADNWEIEDGVKTVGESDSQSIVSFYYKKILDASETTERLVKSVTLSEDTKNVFKDFTFDLNVHLDSAQVTYDDNQTTMNAKAITAGDATTKVGFNEVPTPNEGLTLTSTFTWAPAPASTPSTPDPAGP